MRVDAVVCGVCLLVMGAVWAQPPKPKADVEQAIRDLGNPSFQVRQRAQTALRQFGWDARSALRKAAKSTDPETTVSARKLLAELLPGVTGDTSNTQRALVRQYMAAKAPDRARRTMEQLLKEKPVPHGVVLALLDWDRDEPRRKVVAKHVCYTLRRSLPKLLVAGDFATYESYLAWDVRLEDKSEAQAIAAYMYRRGKLGKLQQYAAEKAKSGTSSYACRLLAECMLLSGQDDEALAVSRASDDWPLLQRVLVRLGRWGELADEMMRREPTPTERGRLRLAGALRLAGRHEEAAKTLAQVMVHGEKGNGVRLVEAAGPTATAGLPLGPLEQQGFDRTYVFPKQGEGYARLYVHGKNQNARRVPRTYLLAFGFTGDVIQLLVDQRHWYPAARLLVAQGRYEEVDRLWLAAIADAEPTAKCKWEVERARALRRSGDPRGTALAEQLLERCRNGKEEGLSPEADRKILETLYRRGFRDLLPDRMPDLVDYASGGEEKEAQGMAWCWTGGADNSGPWWEVLRKQDPRASMVDLGRRLRAFLTGQLSEQETGEMLQPALHPEGEAEQRVAEFLMVAHTCRELGRQNDVRQAYDSAKSVAARSGDEELLNKVFRSALELVGPAEDWARLAEAWRWLGENKGTHWLGHAAGALIHSGDHSGGAELLERAVLLSADLEVGLLLDALTDWGWREYYGKCLRLVLAGSRSLDSGTSAAARVQGGHELVLRVMQRKWYESLPPASRGYRVDGMLALNASLAFAESRCLIDRGRADLALTKANRAVTMCPEESWQLIGMRRHLIKVGRKAAGDKLVRDALAHYQRILDRHPNDDDALYGYSWLSANTQIDLATGEAYNRRAMKKPLEKGAFVECLAVLQYSRGETAKAIETRRRCLQFDPAVGDLIRLAHWLAAERKKQAKTKAE